MTSLLNKDLSFDDIIDIDLDDYEDVFEGDDENSPDYYNEDSNRAEFGDIECIECDNLGEIVDVFDIAYEDLGELTAKLGGKVKVKAVAKPKLKIAVQKPTIKAQLAAKAVGRVAAPKLTLKAIAPKIQAKAKFLVSKPIISAARKAVAANLKVAIKPKVTVKKPTTKAKITAKGAHTFVAKIKAKSPTVSAKHVEKIHAAIADAKIKSIRKKKALPKKRPASTVALIPKTSEQAICLGTTMTPKQIIDVVKNKYKKHSAQVIAQAKRCAASLSVHKANGTARKLAPASPALKKVMVRGNLLKTTALSDSALRMACGIPG